MKDKELKRDFQNLWQGQKPFVFFRAPNTNSVRCFFQKDSQLFKTFDFKINGFLMGSFIMESETAYIPSDHQKEYAFNPTLVSVQPFPLEESKEEKQSFFDLVHRTKKAIHSGLLKKLVVSRKIKIKHNLNPFELFNNLLHLYPQAMVYFWHHPVAGTWMGASPERLFGIDEYGLKTMSLAGTLPFNSNEIYHWGAKEKLEQALVTQSIKKVLRDLFNEEDIECSETYTKRAGNLVHLCNDISVNRANVSVERMIKNLHPTPAVGGIPKQEGLDFIASHEKFDRQYYSGCMGDVDLLGECNLYVNLRCAQLKKESISLYVGAGITAESDAEQEWEETQNKAQTILQAL